MSFAEYEVLERPFGWKVEYWDGHARFTPRGVGVHTCIDLSPRPLTHNHSLVPVDPTYTDQMISGYFDAFINSVEFFCWPANEVQKCAVKGITRYFDGEKGEPLPASVIALDPTSRTLAGLALFVLKSEERPHLELLYVRSPFQRQGIATAMVNWGVNWLLEAQFQELFSTYHVCNRDSQQWHHNFGFRDIYDIYYIQMKVAWLNQEIWRREKLGQVVSLEALIQERDEWESQLDLEPNRAVRGLH